MVLSILTVSYQQCIIDLTFSQYNTEIIIKIFFQRNIGKRANGIKGLKCTVDFNFFFKKKSVSLKLFPKSQCLKMFGLYYLLEIIEYFCQEIFITPYSYYLLSEMGKQVFEIYVCVYAYNFISVKACMGCECKGVKGCC